MLLKCYQYLGRAVNVKKVDAPIRRHLAKQLGLDGELNISSYPKTNRHRHLDVIRDYLEINTDKKSRRLLMKQTAMDASKTKENLADIVNCIIDELVRHNYELPAYQELVRVSRAARVLTNRQHYEKILAALSNEQKQTINRILGIDELSDDDTPKEMSWLELKQEPKKPGNRNVKTFIEYVKNMKALRKKIDIDVSFIVPARLEHLRDEAIVTDRSDMQHINVSKRYALVVILIYMKSASAIDDLVQILTMWMNRIEARAKQKLEEYRLKQAEKTDKFILLLYNMLIELKNNKIAQDQINAIDKHLEGNLDEMIEQCKDYLGMTEEKHISWMKKPYSNKRSVIFYLLEQLTIVSSTQEKSIERALDFIKHHQNSHKEWLEIKAGDPIQPDLSFLSSAWLQVATQAKTKDSSTIHIHRNYYEIAVLQALQSDLNCSDAYVEHAFIYDNPNKQFLSWEEFAGRIDNHCTTNNLPKESTDFAILQQKRVREAAQAVDDNYQNNPYLVINDGRPVLKKPPTKKEPPELDKIKKLVMDEMPIVSIVDAMIEVEKWLNLSTCFKPLSGKQPKIQHYPSRFIATSLAYGCNLGPTQTTRCLPAFSRKQIA